MESYLYTGDTSSTRTAWFQSSVCGSDHLLYILCRKSTSKKQKWKLSSCECFRRRNKSVCGFSCYFILWLPVLRVQTVITRRNPEQTLLTAGRSSEQQTEPSFLFIQPSFLSLCQIQFLRLLKADSSVWGEAFRQSASTIYKNNTEHFWWFYYFMSCVFQHRNVQIWRYAESCLCLDSCFHPDERSVWFHYHRKFHSCLFEV